MDYATDMDLDEPESRRRRRGGVSFLIVLIGTACLVAAWILSAGDPYGDLAHRVVEVRTADATRADDPTATAPGPVGLLPDEEPVEQGPIGLLPDVAEPEAEIEAVSQEDAFRQAIGSLPKAPGRHPVEIEPAAGDELYALNAPDIPSLPLSPRVTVPMEELAAPPEGADEAGATGAVELTRAQRRAVQRRLGMAGYDAGGTDGVFGPRTEAAVSSYQEAAGLPATGRIDRATLETLRAETDAEYAAWAESRRAIVASRSARRTAAEEGVRGGAGDCVRDAAGNITSGGIGCSLRGFGTNLRDAFGGGQRGGAGFQPGADR